MSLDAETLKAVNDAVYYVVFHFSQALLAVRQRDSYLYWPFLLSTILIVALVSRRTARAPGVKGVNAWEQFFSGKLWWHPSARADYRLYFVNALLFPVICAPLLVGDAQIVRWMESIAGSPAVLSSQGAEAAGWMGRILFTLAFFVAFDFGRFVAHSLLHDIPPLWEFHKVHHSAEVLTPITAYRAHPMELLIMSWVSVLMTGLVTWIFNLAGGGVSIYTFLGLHVAVWTFSLIDNLRHSPVWISYGQSWGRWLISPAHHQVHHSIEPQHWGRNRGSNLAIWDRLYGTLYVPGNRPEAFRLGLGDGTDGQWNSVAHMYFWPLAGCARQIRGFFRNRAPSHMSGSPGNKTDNLGDGAVDLEIKKRLS